MPERARTEIANESFQRVMELVHSHQLPTYKKLRLAIEKQLLDEYGDEKNRYLGDRVAVEPRVLPYLLHREGISELLTREYVYGLANHLNETASAIEGDEPVSIIEIGNDLQQRLSGHLKDRFQDMGFERLQTGGNSDAQIVVFNWPEGDKVRLPSLPYVFKSAAEIIIIGDPDRIIADATQEELDVLAEEFDITELQLGEGQMCYSDDLYPYGHFGLHGRTESHSRTLSIKRKVVQECPSE